MADEEKIPVEDEGQDSPEQLEEAPLTVSRRDFLIGAGAGVVVTGAAAGGYIALRAKEPAPAEVTQAGEAGSSQEAAPVAGVSDTTDLPASLRAVTLNIDGQSYDVVVDVRESLWETMTNTMGLGSRTALGCDRAQCGACAVVVDGLSVNGCTVLTARLGRGQEILTVKGITTGDGMEDLHPIQTAFIENYGFQCAICSRGFIMSTYALLSKNPNPTEEEIRKGLEGNICRCGNYSKILDSVFAAAEAMG
ncbi:MAG TPA: 2Fe-2S iron-sulfur cluster-binding protein [Anaerolineae bacterium]|jgi:aerobic-type carbon monoxide dehydrogenase small subunit (CoxS/CutS family)